MNLDHLQDDPLWEKTVMGCWQTNFDGGMAQVYPGGNIRIVCGSFVELCHLQRRVKDVFVRGITQLTIEGTLHV